MDFNNLLERAGSLIQKDISGELDSIARNKIQDGTLTYSEDDTMASPSRPLSEAEMVEMRSSNSYQQQVSPTMKTKLPKEIVESMINNPIDTSPLDTTQSILDQMNIKPRKVAQSQQNAKQRQTITEQAQQSQPIQYQQPQIDYSLIKTIVEDCVKKYTGALSKKLLAESKGSNNSQLKAMKIGEKFSFITADGDVYEATLKFKKNIND